MDMLNMPFNITKQNPEQTIQESGIIHWKEEVTYLRNQWRREQVG
jgi:hypothetical protein